MLRFLGVSVDLGGAIDQSAPEVGQREPPGGSIEKAPPKPVLEPRDLSSATFANIARPSKSGILDIYNPATMAFDIVYFE